MAKTGEDSNGLHFGKFEKRWPTFVQIYRMSVCTCIKMSFKQLENPSLLLCGHNFANERLSVCQFDICDLSRKNVRNG